MLPRWVVLFGVLMAFLAAGFAFAVGPVSALLDANDRVDLCSDDYSPAYISDDLERVRVCGTE